MVNLLGTLVLQVHGVGHFMAHCDVAKILIIEDLAKFGYKNRYECF
jgi:hypothetical protein